MPHCLAILSACVLVVLAVVQARVLLLRRVAQASLVVLASIIPLALNAVRRARFALGLSFEDAEHLRLQQLLVLAQAVLLPSEVRHLRVVVETFHAVFEQSHAMLVVRLLLEFEASAVLHEFFHFVRLLAAQFVERHL